MNYEPLETDVDEQPITPERRRLPFAQFVLVNRKACFLLFFLAAAVPFIVRPQQLRAALTAGALALIFHMSFGSRALLFVEAACLCYSWWTWMTCWTECSIQHLAFVPMIITDCNLEGFVIEGIVAGLLAASCNVRFLQWLLRKNSSWIDELNMLLCLSVFACGGALSRFALPLGCCLLGPMSGSGKFDAGAMLWLNQSCLLVVFACFGLWVLARALQIPFMLWRCFCNLWSQDDWLHVFCLGLSSRRMEETGLLGPRRRICLLIICSPVLAWPTIIQLNGLDRQVCRNRPYMSEHLSSISFPNPCGYIWNVPLGLTWWGILIGLLIFKLAKAPRNITELCLLIVVVVALLLQVSTASVLYSESVCLSYLWATAILEIHDVTFWFFVGASNLLLAIVLTCATFTLIPFSLLYVGYVYFLVSPINPLLYDGFCRTELVSRTTSLLLAIKSRERSNLEEAIFKMEEHPAGYKYACLPLLCMANCICFNETVRDRDAQVRNRRRCRRPWVRWQYEVEGLWHDYEDGLASELESGWRALQANPDADTELFLTCGRSRYEVNIDSMQQRNVRTGRLRGIRRIEPSPAAPREFLFPATWDFTSNELLVDVTLNEHGHMQRMLSQTAHSDAEMYPDSPCLVMQDAEVVRVLRVQSRMLWQLFCFKRLLIQEEMSEDQLPLRELFPSLPFGETDTFINEVFLFHGTTRSNADIIIEEGFDERVSGRMYGFGLYLTTWSCKAQQYAREEDTRGLRCIIVARAVLGRVHDVCASDTSMRLPPRTTEGLTTHSILANPGEMPGAPRGYQHHTEVIVFDGEQLYPEFVVEFRCAP